MEKKYVLAKDTPTAKKGDKIQIDELSVFVHNKWNGIECLFMINNPNNNVNAEIARLLKEGWIEEVKPLEVWVNLYSEDNHQGIYGNIHDSLENAVQYRDSCYIPFIRTVHFIEAPEGETK